MLSLQKGISTHPYQRSTMVAETYKSVTAFHHFQINKTYIFDPFIKDRKMLELRDNQNERKWNSRKLLICTAFQKANLPAIKEMNSLEFLLSPSGNTALQF